MKSLPLPWALLLLAVADATAGEPNQLTPSEAAAGWRLLFDGQSTQGWRGFKKDTFPSFAWTVENGWLKKIGGVKGGDIVTPEQFGDFELTWEWKIATNVNNGVKYFISEERDGPYGHEYQIRDDTGHPHDAHCTAALYALFPARADVLPNPPGQINFSRILVQSDHVEHWLNGTKVLEYTLGSPELLAAVAESKFRRVPGFGMKRRGHILLTDHGGETFFRSIKLREIKLDEP